MKQEELDQVFMTRALQIARLGEVKVAPNPMVGCVITYKNKIIGEGYHREFGKNHAEVNAIQTIQDLSLLSDATIYVTLEPCSHHGKTPPCADLILKHKLKRVVIACEDTSSKVAGKGIKKLRDAGIKVAIGILEKEARLLNKRFFTFHEEKRPYVFLKWAETRDGFIDYLPENRGKGIHWITQPRVKLYVHKWRSTEQAIMVGWKTINNDNPQLNVRKIDAPSPHRFIIDPNGNANPSAKVFTDEKPTTIITQQKELKKFPSHVEVITLPSIHSKEILKFLHQKKIISVFIEGGAQTLTHFIKDKSWEEAYQWIGNTTFQKGLKAPVLEDKVLIEEKSIEEDILRHYLSSKNIVGSEI